MCAREKGQERYKGTDVECDFFLADYIIADRETECGKRFGIVAGFGKVEIEWQHITDFIAEAVVGCFDFHLEVSQADF